MTLESPPLPIFFSLPLAGSEASVARSRGRRAKASQGGGSSDTLSAADLLMTLTPPPDRRFAHSRCETSAFCRPRTATEGRLCTLPALASLAGEGQERAE